MRWACAAGRPGRGGRCRAVPPVTVRHSQGLRAENTAYVAGAGNPEEVADAIDQCIRADDPPARVVVGEDAKKWVKLVRDTDPDSFAKLLRAEVATLAGP
jgi:hypothetical protein